MKSERRIILRNAGSIDPEKIDDYISTGGYKSAEKALVLDGNEIIEEIIKSGLRGRGGAGFLKGLKARYTRQAVSGDGQKYLVCNADEGEPGTFKDRIIIENDPHLLIEGIVITSYLVGASMAYIYLRGEYIRSIYLLNRAVQQAKERGYLGQNIFGTLFSLEIEVKQGAGSYLCGEELTLLESLEGKRGYPRIKPPFPADKGLFDKPTIVSNVETLANIPRIIEKDSSWFASLGMKDSTGTKIFSVSGSVNKPGFYEVEMGVTLRELIFELAGGISSNRQFKAALVGGAAGTFVDESVLDIPIGYDSLKAIGVTLGSGAVIVLDDTTDMVQITRSILKFFKHESCGKCVPCRIGTTHLLNLIDQMSRKQDSSVNYLDALVSEAYYMARTSLCPLGQSPILPLASLQRYFSHEFLKD
jgi:NADH:ubiquinone oxidoreductase subunit F (NADH-binding)